MRAGKMLDPELINHIYEAAAVPSLWQGKGVLERLAKFGDCTDAAFFAINEKGLNGWATNDSCFEKMQIYLRDNWALRNPYTESAERQARFNEPRFLLDTEVMSPEEMAGSAYYREFMKPHGVYWHTGTSIIAPSGDVLKISVHRNYNSGPLKPEIAQRLTALRPHIARAALLTARLRFEQVRAAVEAFDVIGLATAAIRSGRVVIANAGFEKLLPAVVQDRRARLTFIQRSADACWANVLATPSNDGGSFPLAATETHPTMVAHALPIVGASRDIFSVADMLLVMTSSAEEGDVDPKIMEGLFDLTPAEAAIARDLTLGKNLNTVAQARGVTVGTVRSQLKSIFYKTGTHRQVDLVRLLSGIRTTLALKSGIGRL
jgi:DNA-binding CsgD family transcriptional regulator